MNRPPSVFNNLASLWAPARADAAHGAAAAQRTLLTEGTVYVLVEIAQQAITLLSLPVLFFFLSIEDFGVITAAVMISQVTMFASTLGIDFTLLRLYYVWPEEKRFELASGIMTVALLWSLVLVALCLLVAITTGGSYAYRYALLSGAVGGIALGVRNIPLAVVRVTGQTRMYALAEVGAVVGRTALQLGLVIGGFGALGYMIGYALAPFVSVTLLLSSRALRAHWSRPTLALDRKVWSYTWSVLPSFTFGRFLTVVDRVVLFGWASLDQLGLYGAASRFSSSLKLLTGGFKMAIAPTLSRSEGSHEGPYLFFSLSRLLLLTMLFVGSAVMLVAWCIQFTPWATHSNDLLKLVALLILAQFLGGFGVIWQTRFYYSSKPEGVSFAIAASAVALVVGLAILVPRFGIIGAAIAQAVASAVNIAVLAITEARQEKKHDRSWHELIAMTALFLPTVVGTWLVEPAYHLYVLIPTFLFYGVVTATTILRLWERRPSL